MFTGIIEKVGRLKSISARHGGARLSIELENNWTDLEIGESIAVNGACLTLTEFGEKILTFDVSPETLRRTNLGMLPLGFPVNLERALKLGDRLGGHIVLGHVDGLGTVTELRREGNFYTLRITLPRDLTKYAAEKGSIAVDGISLTIARKIGETVEIAIVPHTFKNTNLAARKPGDKVNVEMDIIARYVESLLGQKENLSLDFLKKHGFI